MPRVMITPEAMQNVRGPYVAMLEEAGFEVCYPNDPELARGRGGEAATMAELRGMSAVLASSERYDPHVLDALPDLRVIARVGVGFDRVNVPACTERRKAVTITPTANHEAVAELALALLFAVAKRVVVNDAKVRRGEWPRQLLRPLRGETMGILGLGRIGRSMAVRTQALGMPTIACEQFPDQQFIDQHGIELVDFDTLLARSDFISVHCPLNDDTHGLFNKDVFARMKPDSVLLNTARGGLVVEADLLQALTSGHLSGAGLDVFEVEPPSADNPLFQLENVVVSPHIAGTDEKSLEAMGVEAADCIIKLSRNEWPDGAVVNADLRDTWSW